MRPTIRYGSAILAIVLVGVGANWLLRPAHGPTKPVSALPSPSSHTVPAISLPGLDSSLRAVADGDRGASRDRWEPEYVVGQIGRDPKALYRWVRRGTVLIPYRGVLRGPVGVLLDRQGNSLDRALLLSTLLQKAGHTVRIAHAELTHEQAFSLVPALLARAPAERLLVPAADDDSALARDVRSTAARYGLDPVEIERKLVRRSASMTRALGDLNARAAGQARRLRALLPAAPRQVDSGTRLNVAIDALTDHWWVQLQEGGSWVNLDLDFPDEGVARRVDVPQSTTTTTELDSSLYHRITVRLVTEHWASGTVHERKAFETALRSADVIGQTLTMQIWPRDWHAESVADAADPAGAFRSAALEQRGWRATLFVGGDVAADVMIDEGGEASGAAAGGPFAGLGRGIKEGVAGSNPSDAVLTAAWLEYEVRVPGKPARTTRRVLFDLLGESARVTHQVTAPKLDDTAKLTRSLALMRSTEILPVASRFAPEFLMHREAETLLHNGGVVRSAMSRQAPDGDVVAELAGQVQPNPSTLYAVALARFAGPRAAEVYIDQPNILTRHVFPALATSRPTSSPIVLKEAIDIVANDVGVSLTAPDAVATRLRQGVFDTDAEALVPPRGDPSESVADAFAGSSEWVALSPGDDARLSSLHVSADVRERIAADLRAGYVVVTPTASVRTGVTDFFGWWRVDPASGQTLGVSANGWGQSLAERAMLVGAAFLAGYTFEYLLCEGLLTPYGTQKTDISSRDPTLLDLLATPAAAQPVNMIASKECRLQALISGAIGAGVQFLGVTWDLVRLTILRSRFAAVLVGEAPLFQSGPVEPGDLPPVFGPKPPPPDCPGGGGAGTTGEPVNPFGKTQPAGEPVNPMGETQPAGDVHPLGETQPAGDVHPLGETEPGGPPASQPQPAGEAQPGVPAPAGEAAPTGESDGVGFFWNEEGDLEMLPAKPEYFERELARNARLRPAVESKFDDARQANVEPQQDLGAAQERYNKAVQEHPEGSREVDDARIDLADAETAARRSAKEVRYAKRNVEAVESRDAYLRRLQSANERYQQALNDKAAADQEFARQLQNGKGFDGPEYDSWKQANAQYQAARKDFYNAVGNGSTTTPAQASAPVQPPAGPGATEAMPNRPIPGPGATQPMVDAPPVPGPGPTLPLGNSPTLPACGSGGGGPAPASAPEVAEVVGATGVVGSEGAELVGPSNGDKK